MTPREGEMSKLFNGKNGGRVTSTFQQNYTFIFLAV